MNLLITGAARFNNNHMECIKEMGHHVWFMQNENESMPVAYETIEGVVCNSLFLYHEISRFVNLKYIQLVSAGYDRVPLDYVKRHNIRIYNAKGVYSIPMAEFAIATVLQIYKCSDFFREKQNRHQWEKHRGLMELHGKRVCIVGCGSIGTECAKRFTTFGCEVIGVATVAKKADYYNKIVAASEMPDVLSEADIIVLSLPLTDKTKYMINKEIFKIMKNGTVLINIARGAIINTVDMIEALEKKKIFAVLDVFETEPLTVDSPLWNMNNVYLTPHNSFISDKNEERLYRVVMQNLVNWSRKDETKEYFGFSKQADDNC